MITIAIAEDCKEHIEKITQLIGSKINLKIIKHTWSGMGMIEWLNETKTLPNVLIADYEMNPMDGQQLVKYVSTKFMGNGIKILAFSGHHHHYAINSMFECGAIGYQTKSILHCRHLEEGATILCNAIETVASGKFYIDSFIDKNTFDLEKTNVYAIQNAYNYNLNCSVKYYQLTPTEYDILFLFCCGFKTKQLATNTCVSEKTIESHLHNIRQKLRIYNDRDQVMQVIRLNLVPSARYEILMGA